MAEQTRATMRWETGLRFAAHTGSGHPVTLDSPSSAQPAGGGPMELMLVAIAGCTAMDVVSILTRMREQLSSLTVDITGDRAEHHPKRYTAIAIAYRLRGTGLSREKAERAVQLSHTTYCSAIASLRPDCPVTTSIEIAEA
jgi:putative redox protein